MAGILNIQVKPTIGNKELNLKKIEHFIKKYSDKKLDLVVMPEFFSTGISHEEFINNPVDENGGDTIEFIKDLATKYNTNIIAGTVIEKSEDKLYNTSFIIDRKGEIVDKYRKIHLFNYMGGTEGDRITAGDREVVVNLDFGKVGLGICFDIRYPLHYNKLIKQGADIIVLPTAWVIPNEIYNDSKMFQYAQEMWIAMNRTRAYDNMVYVVSCNQTKKVNDNISALGNSLIIAPNAEILAEANLDECALYADVDLDLVKYYRQIYPIANID
ncbi:hypothetical protein HDR58_10825 [bacterium]|nr:hypothetical protein [bacterium]